MTMTVTKVGEPSYRQRIGYQAGLLGGFTMLAATLLVMGHIATHEVIAEREAEDLRASLAEVIPAESHDNDLLAAPMTLTTDAGLTRTLYLARRGEQLTAVAFRRTAQGYAGPIELLLGLDTTGTILGVRVLSHSETPGLGDKIEVARDPWILAFNGCRADQPAPVDWAVKKDGGVFDQFTGATITPRAIVREIKMGVDFFAAERAHILAATAVAVDVNSGDLTDER